MSEISGTRLAMYTLAAFAGGAALAIVGVILNPAGPAASEDQPPIIVRDGSVIFEGGDSNNPKKGQDTWVQLSSPQQWKAIKNNAHHVASFTVYVAGVVDPNPTTGCPQTTMPGDAVEIDYSTGSLTPPTALTFHVVHTDDGNGHHSPQVNADDKSGLTAGTTTSGSAPPQLLADVGGQGWIAKVIATDPNTGASVTCNLPKPLAENRSLVRVTIVPERK